MRPLTLTHGGGDCTDSVMTRDVVVVPPVFKLLANTSIEPARTDCTRYPAGSPLQPILYSPSWMRKPNVPSSAIIPAAAFIPPTTGMNISENRGRRPPPSTVTVAKIFE